MTIMAEESWADVFVLLNDNLLRGEDDWDYLELNIKNLHAD